jgi:hypothetical protein
MAPRLRSSSFLLFLSLLIGAVAAACGSSGTSSTFDNHNLADGGDNDGTTQDSGGFGDSSFLHPDGSGGSSGGSGDSSAGFDVEPTALQTVTVTLGMPVPKVTFQATDMGQPVTAGWSVDQGNLASITAGASASGVVTPTALAGGLVTVTAGRNGVTLQRQVFIKLVSTQNGPNTNPGEVNQIPTSPGQITAGGGVGGVGGTGLGVPVTDMPTLAALGAPTSNGQAEGLALLYPYNNTVWPRGLLAPLLQWYWSTGDADAIEIKLSTTSGSFSYTGTFGRPAILATTMGKYVNAPIPQDVWSMATQTAGGPTPNGAVDQLTLGLVVAKGGVGYGPLTETWTIAPALLDGTIYYNSYGTELSQNYCCDINNNLFGGAVLSINVGNTAPKLVAGGTLPPPETNPATTTGDPCRVCHSVAASGSMLVVQHDSNRAWGDAYALAAAGTTETPLSDPGGTPVADSTYSGIYPDGTKTLTRAGAMLALPGGTLTATQPTGLPATPYMPAFSPDGTLVAFNSGAGSQLTVMSFDNTTFAFTASTTVVDDSATTLIPAWPSFFPDSKSIVLHHQSNPGIDGAGAEPCTRGGALAQVAWTNLTGPSALTPLDNLNGKGYLPQLPAPSTMTCTADGNEVGGLDPQHTDDVDHNYEPTVLPLGAGGYAWVVFTSRRMYGNVAAIPPFCSDPRGVDLAANASPTGVTNVTTKKLWVAAVDLTQKAGVDSSHPAFYLPGQELLAGNSRGFWVLNPCEPNGSSCTSGDQCCDGFCEQGDAGGLVCGNMPPNATCVPQGDKCTSSAECCLSTDSCIGGFCEQSMAQ